MSVRKLTVFTIVCSFAAFPGCRQALAPDGATPQPGQTASSPASPEGSPLPAAAFKVKWGSVVVPSTMAPGSTASIRVPFTNASTVEWPDPRTASPQQTGAFAVRLAYRWVPKNADTTLEDYSARVDLEKPLPAGGQAVLALEVQAPAKPGSYRLQIDLVQELVGWFEAMGAPTLLIPVDVR